MIEGKQINIGADQVRYTPAVPGDWSPVPTEVAEALDQLAAGGSGGTAFPNRYDLSVNFARAEAAGSTSPLLITGTGVPNVGGFNGGGSGNKSILGCKGHSGLALSAIASISWEWELVAEQVPTFLPYANLVVDVGGGLFKIFTIDPLEAVLLNTGTLTPLGGNKFQFTHLTALNFVQVVNAFTVAPIVSPPVPVAAGAGPVWNNASFRWSDIIASFPTWKLADASSLDGGMPKTTVTPALMFLVGDSSNRVEHCFRMQSLLFNGTAA